MLCSVTNYSYSLVLIVGNGMVGVAVGKVE